MLNKFRFFFLVFIFKLISISSLIAQSSLIQTFSNTSLSSNIGGFLVYVPNDYYSTSKHYPLMIVSHGQGENGNGTNPTNACTTHGPLKEIKLEKRGIKGLYDNFIILAPQFKTYPSNVDTDSCINYMKKNYRIRGKVFLTGLSQGGGGVWNAATSNILAPKIGAIVPICGASSPVSKNISLISTNNIPVWAFHGTNDGIVPVTQSQQWITSINGMLPKINPTAKLTTFLGFGHDSWSIVYGGYSESSINIYEWFLQYETSKTQTILGLNTITNKLVGEKISFTGFASSGLTISYHFSSIPETGVVNIIDPNTIDIVGLGVLTVTAFQDGDAFYKPALNVVQIISITGYLGTISGMPANASSVKYGSPPIVISGGSTNFPLNLSYKSQPQTNVVSISGNTINLLGKGNVTITGILNTQTLTSAFSVVPVPLQVSVLNANKIYGRPNPTFNHSFTGIVNGDNFSVNYLTSANSSSGVGNYAIVPSIAGFSLANYTLSTFAGTLGIQKAPLQVSVLNANKIYGQPNPTFNHSFTGLANGDNFTVNYLTSANSSSGVGNYAIAPSIAGNALANYTLTTFAGTLGIQKAPLQVSVLNANKIYGQPNPNFNHSFTGLANGDNFSVNYLTLANSSSGVGNYAIVPSIAGTALANYTLSTFAGTLGIQKAPLQVSVLNANKIYGQPNPNFNHSFTGLANGDNFTVNYLTSANSSSGVGNYAIAPSISGTALANYTLSTFAGTLDIQKAPLTITILNIERYENEPPPIQYYFSITGLISPLERREIEASIVIKPNEAELTTPGVYLLSASTKTHENFEINFIAGKLKVKEVIYPEVTKSMIDLAQNKLKLVGSNLDQVDAICFQTLENFTCTKSFVIYLDTLFAELPLNALVRENTSITGQFGIIEITSSELTSISSYLDENKSSIYPNPSKGSFRISGPNIDGIELINNKGEKVMYFQDNNEIEIYSKEKGMYFLINEKNKTRIKILIE